MATKKKTAAAPVVTATANQGQTKPVRVELTPDVHRLLRVVSALAGSRSMAEYARNALTDAIRADAKTRGVK